MCIKYPIKCELDNPSEIELTLWNYLLAMFPVTFGVTSGVTANGLDASRVTR